MPSTKSRWAFDPYFSTLTGHQRDADRTRIARASCVPHPPDGVRSNSLHGKSNPTELGQEGQRMLSKTISVADNKNVGGRSGKRSYRERCKELVLQTG
jgi:hypothetical protein